MWSVGRIYRNFASENAMSSWTSCEISRFSFEEFLIIKVVNFKIAWIKSLTPSLAETNTKINCIGFGKLRICFLVKMSVYWTRIKSLRKFNIKSSCQAYLGTVKLKKFRKRSEYVKFTWEFTETTRVSNI